MSLSIKTLNGRRKHLLLTAEAKSKLPPIRANEGKSDEATIVHVKLFSIHSDHYWYITEYDPEENLIYGIAYRQSMSDHMPEGEWGYASLNELASCHRFGCPSIERDLWFKPCSVAEVQKRLREKHAA